MNMFDTKFMPMLSSRTRPRIASVRMGAVAVSFAMMMALSGCAVGPKYQRPTAPVPTQFKESSAPTTQPAGTPAIAYNNWWLVFNDPALDRLEKDVDSAQQDIRIA